MQRDASQLKENDVTFRGHVGEGGGEEASAAQKRLTSEPEYYHSVAIIALSSVLRDRSVTKQHKDASKAIVHIISSLGGRSSPFLQVAIAEEGGGRWAEEGGG